MRAHALVLSAALLGCPADKSSQPPGDERLLAKLKAEKEREAKEGPMVPPTHVEPNPPDEKVNPLAEFAAKGTQRRELALPTKTMIEAGKASLRLNAIEATHTVGEGISITTDEWFLKVTFNATGPEGTEVDLTTAHLEKDGNSYTHARDAQAAFKKPARATLAKDGAAITAFFELPMAALGPGLVLVLGESRLELQ